MKRPLAVKVESRKWMFTVFFASLFFVWGYSGEFRAFNFGISGCLFLCLVGFAIILRKMNETHTVASTGTCDSVTCLVVIAAGWLANSSLHFSRKIGEHLTGNLIERIVAMLNVYFIVRLNTNNHGGVYAFPGHDVGSIEDDGIQDEVIDLLFPPNGVDTNAENPQPTATEAENKLVEKLVFPDFS
jgi:hypothetical protein